MNEKFDITRKADYFLTVEMISKSNVLKDVSAELFIPQNDLEEITLICKPNRSQYAVLINEFEFRLTGYDEFIEEKINNRFYIKRAFCRSKYSTVFSRKKEDFSIELQAYDLMIVCERDNAQEKSETEGYFTISNRFEIPPLKLLQRKPNGEVVVDPYEKYSFKLESGLKLFFDTYYKYEQAKDHVKSFPYAVAEFKTNLDPERINNYVIEIDDFLLLLSLASENIYFCTGWVAFSNIKIVRYFRRDRAIPKEEDKHSSKDYLVEPFELTKFLEKVYNVFINFKEKQLFRNILFPVIRRKKISVETHHLILFAILESIVLNYKRNIGYDPILTLDDFNNLKCDLEKLIKSKLPSEDKDKRKFIYEKLPELNRVSFKSSFELFQKQYNIVIDDLWPLVDSPDGVSLVQIRNKIIHGEIFSDHQFSAISLAVEHLQIIVERMILTLLEWDISNTRISVEYVKQHYSKDFKEVKHYQQLFAE